jgi:ABC-type multidrug transport system ATPase subunit
VSASSGEAGAPWVMGPALELRDIWCSSGNGGSVRGLTLSLDHGEIGAVAGFRDGGAAALVEVLLGWRRPDRGAVRLLGRDPAEAGRLLPYEVGVVLDPPGIRGDLTLEENLRFFADLFRLECPPLMLCGLLEKAGLGGRARERAGRLPASALRRLALARALIPAPRVLVLEGFLEDTPSHERSEVHALLGALAARGKAILLTVSSRELLGECATRVASL